MTAALALASSPLSSTLDLLDRTFDRLTTKTDVGPAMAQLVRGLGEIWSTASRREWADVVSLCRQHAIYELLGEDPFTQRARTKPRGYAGDAVMIDYIYRGLPIGGGDTSPIGEDIFQFTAGFSPSAKSVRFRRDLLAARIDATATRVRAPRILAVACGHLREAFRSAALVDGTVGRLCALDQDRESLDVVAADCKELGAIQICHASVRDILKGTLPIEGYDLIYAAGLYDYLLQPAAKALTTTLAAGLRSGGTLLLGNFLPAPTCVGYMEAMMEWSLVWRSESELAALANDIPRADIGSIKRFADPQECIGYLEVTRL